MVQSAGPLMDGVVVAPWESGTGWERNVASAVCSRAAGKLLRAGEMVVPFTSMWHGLWLEAQRSGLGVEWRGLLSRAVAAASRVYVVDVPGARGSAEVALALEVAGELGREVVWVEESAGAGVVKLGKAV